MQVSIPSLMSTIPGTVEEVHMVSRITPEGSKLFSAEIVVKNEGALTADMAGFRHRCRQRRDRLSL